MNFIRPKRVPFCKVRFFCLTKRSLNWGNGFDVSLIETYKKITGKYVLLTAFGCFSGLFLS